MVSSVFQKIKQSLTKSRDRLMGSLEAVLPFGTDITEDVLEEVEEVLFEADLGVHAADTLVDALREKAGAVKRGETDPYAVMRGTMLEIFSRHDSMKGLAVGESRPHVIMVVGVNGVGKTTTIGKLALRYRSQGLSVLLAACDTFRAAAIEQLEVWAGRADTEFIRSAIDADAAALAYDAITRAKARGTDVVLVDTAGRLHTAQNLMQELKKIRMVVEKALPGAPHETLLVLDATNGQNALTQAEAFNRDLGVSGIALTKLDGTAKGGIVVSVVDRLDIPVRLIGIGEGIDDLRDFDPEDYVAALLEREADTG
jgi:fused signal recognition particle receptor